MNLVSSGTSSEESAFLDASEDGSDVFFLTAAQRSSQDVDTALDVYDAHECSASSPCVPPPADTPDTSPAATKQQLTASFHEYAVSLFRSPSHHHWSLSR